MLRESALKRREDVLVCRLVSKRMSPAVDTALATLPPSWLETTNELENAERIQAFLDNSAQAGSRNPFVGRLCKVLIWDRACFEAALGLFQRFGKGLRRCKLEISFDQSPLSFGEVLFQLLALLPNVKWLTLVFGGDCEDEDEDDTVPVNLARFPPLVELSEMKITFNHNAGMPIPTRSYLKPMLQAYGRQLTTLKCEKVLLTIDGMLTTVNNVRKLETTPDAIASIRQAQWPNIESLTISGGTVGLSKELSETLRKLGESLKQVKFCKVNETVEPPRIPKPLTSVKKLSIGMDTVWSHWWIVFRKVFINVERLEIEMGSGLGIPIEFPLPFTKHAVRLRKRLFKRFPKLVEIKWTKLQSDGRTADEPIFFLRWWNFNFKIRNNLQCVLKCFP